MVLTIPTLQSERLIVRELTLDDLAAINDVLNAAYDADSSPAEREPWLRWTVLGYRMFEMLEQPCYGERAVVLKQNGTLIGAVGVVPYVDRFDSVTAFKMAAGQGATAEVGLFWAIDPAHQGNGYATEAAGLLLGYLTRQWRLQRVIATTGADNLASQRVMQKLGMTVEHSPPSTAPQAAVVGVYDNRSPWRTQLHAVVPHAEQAAVWMQQWQSGWGLPRVRANGYVWNAQTEKVAAALSKRLPGEVWIRRPIYTDADDKRKRVTNVYELAATRPPRVGRWVDRERLATLTLREPQLREPLDNYLRELESGHVPQRRPPWARRGDDWRNAAHKWIAAQVAQLGHTLQQIEQVKHWCLSAILRARTDGPDFYFKAATTLPLFIDEATVTQKLAERFPDYIPAPVAVDATHGWLLFREFGELLSFYSPLDLRQRMLQRAARLQRASVPLVDRLLADGLHDRRLDVLASQIDPLLNDQDAVSQLSAEQIERLQHNSSRLKLLCEQLAGFNIPYTLVHGDLHAGNCARRNGEIIFFDWTDACIAHPFFDLLALHWESNPIERSAMQTAYLDEWRGVETPQRLQQATAIADVLLDLHHAVSYQTINAGIEPSAKYEIGGPTMFLTELLQKLERYRADS